MKNDALRQISWLSGLFALGLLWFVCITVGCASSNGVTETARTQAIVRSHLGAGGGVWIQGDYYLTAGHILGDSTVASVFFVDRWFPAHVVARDGDVILLKTGFPREGKNVQFDDYPQLGEPVYWIQLYFTDKSWSSLLENAIVGNVQDTVLEFNEPGFSGASGGGVFSADGYLLGVMVELKLVKLYEGVFQVGASRAVRVSSLINIRGYLDEAKKNR